MYCVFPYIYCVIKYNEDFVITHYIFLQLYEIIKCDEHVCWESYSFLEKRPTDVDKHPCARVYVDNKIYGYRFMTHRKRHQTQCMLD